MTKLNPEIKRQTETSIPKQVPKGLTPKQREILVHSDHILSQTNTYFFGDRLKNDQYLTHIRSRLSPLTKDLLTGDLRKKLLKIDNQEFENIEKMYETDIQTFISLAINQGLDGKNLEDAIQGWLGKKIIEITLFKNQQISLTEEPQFKNLENEEKLNHVIIEMQRNSIFSTDHFYQNFPSLFAELRKIDDIETLESYFDRCHKRLHHKRDDTNILERLRIEYLNRLKELNQKKQGIGFVRRAENMVKRSEEFKEAFKSAVNYLKYCTPENEINEKAIKLAESLIEKMDQARGVMSKISTYYATSEVLAQFFWTIRCGRGYDITKLEAFGVDKKTLEKYLKFIFDQRLRTEAAAFWFEKNTNELPGYQFNPNFALINAVKSLLDTHQKTYLRKTKRNLRISIIIADHTLLKLSIKPNADVYEIIKSIQEASKHQTNISLSTRQKYNLKRESYKLDNQSQEYQKLSRHSEKQKVSILGIETPFKTIKKHTGDYAIRIMRDPKEDPSQKGNSPFNCAYFIDSLSY